MLKTINHIAVALIALFLLTGCYSKDEKKLVKQYKKQGKINAINHIKKKYNLNATIKSIKEEKFCSSLMPIPDCTPNGDVIVKFSTAEKDFSVYTTGKEETNEGFDDYQISEIEKDIINFFKNNIPLKLYGYKVSYNSTRIKEYYKDNLKSILPYIREIELYYIDKNNLDKLNLNKIIAFLKPHNVKLNLINFKTQEKCNDYKNAKIKNVSLINGNMTNIFKESSLQLFKNEKTYQKYNNITTYNDEVYIYSSKDNFAHKISSSNFFNLNDYKKLYPELSNKKLEQITKAYSISQSSSLLYFYFPKDKVSAEEYEKIFFISECSVNREKKYFIDKYFGLDSKIKIGTIGKYYIISNRYSQCDANSNITFGLIKISNNQKY